jgi:hypothetical protein
VSAFYFLAQKSDSELLKVLAAVTYFLLFAYFAGWSNTFSFLFFPYIKNQRLNFLVQCGRVAGRDNAGLFFCRYLGC